MMGKQSNIRRTEPQKHKCRKGIRKNKQNKITFFFFFFFFFSMLLMSVAQDQLFDLLLSSYKTPRRKCH